MTNEEVINVLNTIYENPTASEQIKEACIVAMEAVSIKNSVERITTGLQISSAESEAKDTMTNAEAIKHIGDLVENEYEQIIISPLDVEAFDLAIKALEREEGCKNISDHQIAYFKCSVCQEWVDANTTMDEHCKVYDFNFCPSCGRKVEK